MGEPGSPIFRKRQPSRKIGYRARLSSQEPASLFGIPDAIPPTGLNRCSGVRSISGKGKRMAQASPLVYQANDPEHLQNQVLWTTAILGASYSGILAVLERALPIKPTWVALEVVGGVLLVGLPVRWIARRSGAKLTWRDYERLVIAGFVGAGAPILIWQAIEYGVLQQRRMRQESGEERPGA